MKILQFIIFVIVFCFIVQETSAIGISPSRIVLHFKPDLEQTLSFTVFNGGMSGTKIKIYSHGELEQIALWNKDILMLPPNSYQTFDVKIKLPTETYEPGDHILFIGAVEQAEQTLGKQTSVAAVTGVESQIYIRVPYPGKYASASIDIGDVVVGKPILFTVFVSSLGSETIMNATAFMDIYDPQDTKITSLTSTMESINAKESKELYAEWLPINVSAGIYRVVVTLFYDEKTTVAETNFRLGDMVIEILDAIAEYVSNDLFRFEIDVQSLWNDVISGVYASINVSDLAGNAAGITTTSPISISRWSQAKLETFLKTNNLEDGIYNALIILHYNDKLSQKQIQFKIVRSSFKMNPLYIVIVSLALIIIYLLLAKKWGGKTNEKDPV